MSDSGGPRIWNRQDVRLMLEFLHIGAEHQRERMMDLMEFVESFPGSDSQPRDEHGRFVPKPRLNLEAAS